MKLNFLLSCALFTALATGCGDKDKKGADDQLQPGKAVLKISNKAGNSDLVLNGPAYINAHGDSFTVTMYKYYLSNLVFVKENGEEYQVPESYYLVDQSDAASLQINVNDIPAGKYTKVKILMGVDSTRNVSGAQTGALDPLHGMFWTWNTGYIMAKVEGYSPQSSALNERITLHLGGFSGKYSSNVWKEFTLPQTVNINSASTPVLNLTSDVLKWFEGQSIIDFATYYSIMTPGEDQIKIVWNYKNSLELTSVE